MSNNKLIIRGLCSFAVDYFLTLSLLYLFFDILFFPFIPLIFLPIGYLLRKIFKSTVGEALFRVKRAHDFPLLRYFKNNPPLEMQKPSWKKTFMAIAFFSLLIGYISYEELGPTDPEEWLSVDDASWEKFTNDSFHFAVDFPDKPLMSSDSIKLPKSHGTLPYEEFRFEAKGDAPYTLAIKVATLPNKWLRFNNQLILKGAYYVVSSTFNGGKITKQGRIKHKGYPAYFFRYEKDEIISEERLVLVDHYLYRIETTYAKEDTEKVETVGKKFINSFEPSIS